MKIIFYRHYCYCGNIAGTMKNETDCYFDCKGDASFSCGNGITTADSSSLMSVYGTKW